MSPSGVYVIFYVNETPLRTIRSGVVPGVVYVFNARHSPMATLRTVM